MNDCFGSESQCQDIRDAISVLEHLQTRCNFIQHSIGCDITDSDIDAATQLSDALECAIKSLRKDVKFRSESQRYKRKYLELKLAVVQALHLANNAFMDADKNDHDVVLAIISCFKEKFSYLFRESSDGSVD